MSIAPAPLLRYLVWSYWLVGCLDVGAAMFLNGYLPPPLLAWQEAQAAQTGDFVSVAINGWMLLLLLSLIVGSLGALRLHNWGRWLFAVANLLMFLSYPLLTAMVYTWFGGLFADIALLITGAILVLCFGPSSAELFSQADVNAG